MSEIGRRNKIGRRSSTRMDHGIYLYISLPFAISRRIECASHFVPSVDSHDRPQHIIEYVQGFQFLSLRQEKSVSHRPYEPRATRTTKRRTHTKWFEADENVSNGNMKMYRSMSIEHWQSRQQKYGHLLFSTRNKNERFLHNCVSDEHPNGT